MYNLIFGIDISKASFDVFCKSMDSNLNEHRCFTNDSTGFKKFHRWHLRKTKFNDSPMVFMEYTGHYSFKLCSFLVKHNISYAPVNPLSIKRSMGIQRMKTDPKDAEDIANYGLKFQNSIHFDAILDEELM
jgi:transposase